MSVYKNYEPGEPTSRLYVKNIAKSVEEKVGTFLYYRVDKLSICMFSLHTFASCLLLLPSNCISHLNTTLYMIYVDGSCLFSVLQDLKYIYGRYIDVSSEAERNMYV